MSLFFAYQTQRYAILLTDSLALKPHPTPGKDTIGISASKLAVVGTGIVAAHAGTWQPAWAMLSDLYALTKKRVREFTHSSFCEQLTEIGAKRYTEYQRIFSRDRFDVRLALIFTGRYRFPVDVEEGFTTSIVLWEVAREFVPTRVRGGVYFGGSAELTSLAQHYLEHPVAQGLLSAGPLSASQTLLSAHAAISHLTTSVSADANIALIGAPGEHTILRGSACTIPLAALREG